MPSVQIVSARRSGELVLSDVATKHLVKENINNKLGWFKVSGTD